VDKEETPTAAAPATYSMKAVQQQAARRQQKQAARRPSAEDYAAQYDYVRQDLRRITLLAGTFFTAMIVLFLRVAVNGVDN